MDAYLSLASEHFEGHQVHTNTHGSSAFEEKSNYVIGWKIMQIYRDHVIQGRVLVFLPDRYADVCMFLLIL